MNLSDIPVLQGSVFNLQYFIKSMAFCKHYFFQIAVSVIANKIVLLDNSLTLILLSLPMIFLFTELNLKTKNGLYFLFVFPCVGGILTLEWPSAAFGSSRHSFINQKYYTDIIAFCHIKVEIVKSFHFPIFLSFVCFYLFIFLFFFKFDFVFPLYFFNIFLCIFFPPFLFKLHICICFKFFLF